MIEYIKKNWEDNARPDERFNTAFGRIGIKTNLKYAAMYLAFLGTIAALWIAGAFPNYPFPNMPSPF